MTSEELAAIRDRKRVTTMPTVTRRDMDALLAEVDRLRHALEKIEGLAQNIADEAHEERL